MGLRYICNLDAHNILNIRRRRELLHFNVLSVSFSFVYITCIMFLEFIVFMYYMFDSLYVLYTIYIYILYVLNKLLYIYIY